MFSFEFVDIALLAILFLFFFIQLIYYWVFLAKPYYYQKSFEKRKNVLDASQPPVSIIVCARNESQNLEDYFPAILEQNYPRYEVIFIDDDSSDETNDVLKRLAYKYPHFYHTYVPAGSKNLSRKKLGLTLGVKAAKYDALLFTEADSHPVSPNWISCMARNFTDKKTVVLGFSSLEKEFSSYPAYDYFSSNLRMISLALKGCPYAGNGRNLAYQKEHFIRQKGFLSSNFLNVGEDDLFIRDIANKNNTAVELSPESMIEVKMNGIRAWKTYKIQRQITHQFYKKIPKFLWRLEELSRFLFYLSFFACLFLYFKNIENYLLLGIALFMFFFRLFTQLFVINKTAGLLNVQKFHFSLFLYDFIQPFVDGYFCLYRLFKTKNRL
jgi:cellulose synthase/poly-beta-1,6-N-acetylglucosamine synthase-like glycosyltransferase